MRKHVSGHVHVCVCVCVCVCVNWIACMCVNWIARTKRGNAFVPIAQHSHIREVCPISQLLQSSRGEE